MSTNLSELDAQFRDPPSSLRGAPFWCWNHKLDKDRLMRQIEKLQQMGMGGFHIHCRTGLDTEYLGDEFMALVKASVEKAKELDMFAWLYDEDRWPSGYAGGLVTQEPEHRSQYLLWTQKPYSGDVQHELPLQFPTRRSEQGVLLARYEVLLEDGYLKSHRRLQEGEAPSQGGVLWYAYLEAELPCIGLNNQTAQNIFSKAATQRFLEVTHEQYAKTVGEEFGKAVPAIFTDEPHFPDKHSFQAATSNEDITLPWSDDLFESYAVAYEQRLEEYLPELFWELPDGKASPARYRYHNHLCDRLCESYLKPISEWCESHNIEFTGHLVEETTLNSQTVMNGDVMRGYQYFQRPGMDLVGDGAEYNTGKQVQSVVRQMGREGMLSELYGATGWDFSFVDFKSQGDWQAALGVTTRVHHLAWVSMEGEAKRDYPGSIFYQQPWWREFRQIEDHYSRVNTLLTRGKPEVRVGVMHPIESYWLCCGPLDQTSPERERRERQFADLTHWLLHEFIEFDFINEALLPSQYSAGPTFNAGEMAYDIVLVPGLRTIRSSTLDHLQAWVTNGGTVVFLGNVPNLVDAEPSERALSLAATCSTVPFERDAVLQALEPVRLLRASSSDGTSVEGLLHQLRREGENLHLFLCDPRRSGRPNGIALEFLGHWRITEWDTFTGDRREVHVSYRDDTTVYETELESVGHRMLTLEPGQSSVQSQPALNWQDAEQFLDEVEVTLSEPNALLLDQARYRWNGGAWQEKEELLRIEDNIRSELGLMERRSYLAQPWTDREPAEVLGTLELAFDVHCEYSVDNPLLSLESQDWKLTLDGNPVPLEPVGWFVDESIHTVALPALEVGRHCLLLTIPFTRKSALEWSDLLGDFGVKLSGRDATIVAPTRRLKWGDWTQQGLPFYTGNVTYHTQITAAPEMALAVEHFQNPLLSVAVNNRPYGTIIRPSDVVPLKDVPSGTHRLDITALGHRHNAFGPVHHTMPHNPGPYSWRSAGNAWTYDYCIRPMGILLPPQLKIAAG